nr:MAG TPA: hypothetical protein [Caudoviricetes sp.]
MEAAMLHDYVVHCIFAGVGKTRGPLHLCVLALRNIQRTGTTDLQMLRPLAPNISRKGVNT